MITIKLTCFGFEVWEDGNLVEFVAFLESVNPVYEVDLDNDTRY